MDVVGLVLVVAVVVALLATFVLPGSVVLNPFLDLRHAGRLWWLPAPLKRAVRARWPNLEPHLRR